MGGRVRTETNMYPNARIPYGTWGSSYFPAWQMSPLAEVNIAQFAGEGMGKILGMRKVPIRKLEYLVTGSTVPWHWKFWNSPLVSSCMGFRIPGYHMEQACATGLQTVIHAAAEIEAGSCDVAGVLTFDRTSDSPVGVFPERRSYQRTHAISDVWDNFGFDPAVGNAMIAAAGNVARKYKLDRGEVDELTCWRYKQYFDTIESGYLNSILVPFDVLNAQGRPMGKVDADMGIRQLDLPSLNSMRELDTCVTSGSQTHAADGMATLLVTNREKVKELSSNPDIEISFVGKKEVRTSPAYMSEAPVFAVRELLNQTNLTMQDMKVVKTHNPFALNDLVFAKELDYDWHKMNNTGCSLVYGHPQGPTLTRTVIEGLEEAVKLGGGYVLISGCAAGDVGIAAIFKVA